MAFSCARSPALAPVYAPRLPRCGRGLRAELGYAKVVAGGARNPCRHRIPPARYARGGQGIRGVNSDGVIASLVDKGLVRELGRDPQRGQAIIYGTTNAFLEKFGLRSTRDLPDLEQFAPDEQSRQFIRERLSGRSIQSTLEEQAEDLDEERELLDTDVAAVEDEDTLVIDETSEDMHDED